MIHPARSIRRTRPAGSYISVAVLGVVALGAAPSSAAPPSAEKVIADAVAAMGGAAAIAKIDTLHTTASVTQGMAVVTVDSYWAKTGERLYRQSMQGMTLVAGYDGKVGWMVAPDGSGPIGQKRIKQLDDQVSTHMRILTMDKTGHEHFRSIKSIDVATFEGIECNRLHVVTTDEKAEEGYLFFDTKTRLPVGWEMTSQGAKGPTTTQIRFSNWKEQNGVQFFRKVEVNEGGQGMVLRIKNVEVNATDMSTFRAPDGIKRSASTQKDVKGDSGRKLEEFSAEQQAQIKQMLKGLMRTDDPAQLEKAAKSIEAGVGFMPPEQRDVMEYVLGKVRERIKTLRGG